MRLPVIFIATAGLLAAGLTFAQDGDASSEDTLVLQTDDPDDSARRTKPAVDEDEGSESTAVEEPSHFRRRQPVPTD